MNVKEARKLRKKFIDASNRALEDFANNVYPKVPGPIIADINQAIERDANKGHKCTCYTIKTSGYWNPFLDFLMNSFVTNNSETAYVLQHVWKDIKKHFEDEGFNVYFTGYDDEEDTYNEYASIVIEWEWDEQ